MLPISSSSYTSPDSPLPPSVEARAWSEIEAVMLARGIPPEHIASAKTQFPPLIAAVQLNDLALCKKIIHLGLPLNQPKETLPTSALFYAMAYGFNDIALFLIENGADLTLQVADSGFTYLHDAICRENLVVAEALLKHNPQLLEQQATFTNPNPQLFLETLSGEPFTIPTSMSITPLHYAMVLPNPQQGEKMAALLIQQGAQISKATSAGCNYLHLAATKGYVEVCRLLLNKGLNIDSTCSYTDTHGFVRQITPLRCAASIQAVSTAKLLLDLHASFDIGTGPDKPLHCAVRSGNEALIRCFLDKGATIDQVNQFGHPEDPELLKILVLIYKPQERIPLLQLWIKLGMDVHHRTKNQNTYLHNMASFKEKDLQLFQFLIDLGLDVNALNNENQSPLHLTVDADMISLLLQNGANARIIDQDATTPLLCYEARHPSPAEVHAPLIQADKGLTTLINNLKLLGLRHSLPGNLFEGSTHFLAYAGIAHSLESYLKTITDAPSFVQQLPSILRNSNHLSPEEIVEKIHRGEVVSIAAGWFKHAITVICSKDCLMIGNRGDCSGEEPGLKIYNITSPSHIPQAIKKILSIRNLKLEDNEISQKIAKDYGKISEAEAAVQIREEKKTAHIEYLKCGILQELGLERLDYLPLKHQITGNCTWVGAKMALKGLLIWHFMKENPSLTVQQVLPLVKNIYAKWLRHDLINSLSVLEQAQAEPLLKPFFNVNEVYDELLAANFFREDIRHKLETLKPALLEHPKQTYHRLTAIAYRRQNAKLLKWLLDKDAALKIDVYLGSKPEINQLLLSYFIKGGLASNIIVSSGESALDHFCSQDNKELALQLLQAWKQENPSPSHQEALKNCLNHPDNNGFTPTHSLFLQAKNLHSIQALIQLFIACGADLTALSEKGNTTPLESALFCVKTPQDVDIFKTVLDACPDKKQALNRIIQNELTLFDFAIRQPEPNDALIQLLLDQGAELAFNAFSLEYYKEKGLKLELKDAEGNTPLHHLCKWKNKTFALELLEAWKQESVSSNDSSLLKQKINSPNHKGYTPFKLIFDNIETLTAIEDILPILLDSGADLTQETSEGKTALHSALSLVDSHKDVEIFKTLLEACPDKSLILNKHDQDEWTILHYALYVQEYNLPLLKFLLEAFPDKSIILNKQDKQGFTLLDYAVPRKENSLPIIQLLLEHGARLHDTFIEQIYRFPSLFALYKQKGLEMDIKTPRGLTPLHGLCVQFDTPLALELLNAWKQEAEVSNKANLLKQKVNAANEFGYTPLHGLLFEGTNLQKNKELLALVMECGADVSSCIDSNRPPIHDAIFIIKQVEDLEIIKLLLKNPEQVQRALNPTDRIHTPPLYDIPPDTAWSHALAKLLIDHGAKLYFDAQGNTMLPKVIEKFPDLHAYYLEKYKQ